MLISYFSLSNLQLNFLNHLNVISIQATCEASLIVLKNVTHNTFLNLIFLQCRKIYYKKI